MRNRPSHHIRKVWTRFGRRIRLINPWIRKRPRNYGSQLFRSRIGQDIKLKGPYKKPIIGIFEKDPLLWKEYKSIGKPEIIIDPDLHDKEKAVGSAELSDNKIHLEEKQFKGLCTEPYESIRLRNILESTPEEILESEVIESPRESLAHEVQHFKDKPLYVLSKKPSESSAFWRSQFDIRKNKPLKPYQIERMFKGPILKRDVRLKKDDKEETK